MPKFTVYFMTPYMQWDGVEAESEDEACSMCPIPCEYDLNESFTFVAIEEAGEDEEEDA
jgi:hypothetical protein